MAEKSLRQNARFKAAVPIELRPQGVNTPLRGQTTDIGMGGCYVEMSFTQEVGTLVDIALWVEDAKISVTGKVVSKHPSFGNGFKFVQLTSEQAAKLSHYFEALRAQGLTLSEASSSEACPTTV